jgi:putative transposase
MARIPASKETRKRLTALFEGGGAREGNGSELVKLAARLIVEEALEEEVEDVVGRGYYAHGDGSGGHRNGYRRGKLDTAEGQIEYAVPQVRGTVAPFRSAIREVLGSRTEELERLAIEMYARGLSVRDIEAAFSDANGKSLLSKSAVSQVSERLWADYQAFAGRDLSEHRLLYLFLDGIAERLHLGQPREAVLAAWGITATGEKVLLGLCPGTKEDTANTREFLRDLRGRNLAEPLLVVGRTAAPEGWWCESPCDARSANADARRRLRSHPGSTRWRWAARARSASRTLPSPDGPTSARRQCRRPAPGL